MRRVVAVAAALAALCVTSAQATDQLVPGKIIVIKPAKLTKVIDKPISPAVFALPSNANSPLAKPWAIWCKSSGVWGHSIFSPAGWKGLGNPPGVKGYKYKGAGTLADPCRVVLVKPKIVKAVCKQDICPTSPPYASPVPMQIGAADTSDRYCSEFGGTVLKNQVGLFKAKDAPPPSACASPSGAFLDDSGLF